MRRGDVHSLDFLMSFFADIRARLAKLTNQPCHVF